MIHRSLLFWVLAAWGTDLFLMAFLPAARLLVDPLFFLLAFLGFRSNPHRFLWLQAVGLGLLKDLSTGALLGGWACTFGLTGILLGMGSRLVEVEDPLIAGVWVAVYFLAATVLYALTLSLADPFIRGFHLPWLSLPFSMAAHGALAAWGFPRLRRLLRTRAAAL
ncbi:MAG: hypothetical protein HYZ94_03225 [Candidatus Omnitrophica bacterium]|nr:hypothetical protein [Candidatus Omnitrophota bacterium]